jgi:signal transduction histidine kinase
MALFKNSQDFSRKRGRKVFLNIGLFIAIPSLLLLILAYRGISNDQALRDKEMRLTLQALSNQIETNLYQQIDSISTALLNNETMRFVQIKASQPLVLSTFDVRDNSISIYSRQLLHSGEKSISNPISIFYKEGWQYEFVEQHYSKAINFYKEQLKLTGDSSEQVHLHMVIARLHNKNQDRQKSIEWYELIREEYHKFYLTEDLPAGIVASLELVKLYISGDQLEVAAELLLGIKEELVSGNFSHWTMSEFNFYMDELGELWSSIEERVSDSQRKKATELQQLYQINDSITNYLVKFQDINIQDANSKQYKIAQYADETYYYLIQPVTEEVQVGIIFNLSEVVNLFEKTIKELSPDIIDGLVITNERNQALLSSFHPSEGFANITFLMGQKLPPWSYTLHYKEASLMDGLESPSKNPFFFMIIIIFSLIVFGIVLSVRYVNQEMLLAKMKSDFISTVSHEFKSPLTSIRQMLELLHTRRVSSEERKQQYIETMLKESERLTHLLENTLDFSRLEAGKKQYDMQVVDLNQLITSSCSGFEELNPNYQVKLRLSKNSISLFADETALRHLLNNLLDNAAKYTDPNRPNEISISTKTESEMAILTVEDTGLGISDEDKKQIFDRFFRAGDSLTRKVKGTGIGLSIVQTIVNDHSGKIDVESNLGTGSKFIIHFPITKP